MGKVYIGLKRKLLTQIYAKNIFAFSKIVFAKVDENVKNFRENGKGMLLWKNGWVHIFVFFISLISAVLKRVNVCASISGAELSNIPLKNCSHNHGNRLQKYVDIFS